MLKRRTQLLGAALFPFAMLAAPAMAQQSDVAAESADKDPVIVVTGSRVRDFVSNSPVTSIGEEQLRFSGELNIEEVLNDLPQIVPGSNAANNNPGGGQATVDLRGLGTARTLVLVNGRRFAPSTGTGVVDLNNLPLDMIERVEVLTGGASAVYGSDAISGVVNFVIADDFEGIEARAYYGVSDEGDADRNSVSLRAGINLEDRGNITAYVSYFDRESVLQGDRPFSFLDFNGGSATGTARLDQVGANPFPSAEELGLPSGIGRPGLDGLPCPVASTGGGAFAFENDGTVRAFCNDLSLGAASDRFNFAPVNFLVVPQERFSINTLGHYDILGDKVTAYFEGFFTNSTVLNQLAPTPLAPTGSRQALVTPGVTPFLTPEAEELLAARPDPDAPALLRRRLTELGPRIATFNSNVFSINSGLRGEVTPRLRYDLYYSYQRSEFVNTIQGDQSISRIQASLDGCPEGSPDDCTLINFFGVGTIDQAGIDFIALDGLSTQTFDRNNFVATVSGEPFDLPAGPLGVALGFEYREDSLSFLPDDSFASGDLVGFNAQQAINGGFDVYEFFGELSAPILRDAPFAKSFDIEGGFRVSDYSSVGTNTTFKGGGAWSPIEDVKVRGLFQRAVRAPSVFELFQAGDQGFPLYSDPCATEGPFGGGVSSAAIVDACTAQFANFGLVYPVSVEPGATFDTTGTFFQTNVQLEQILFGGADLNEERSRTFTVGTVIKPRFLPSLTLAVDYYDIRVRDAIGRRFSGGSALGSADGALDLCIAQGGVPLADGPEDPCFGVIRTSSGDAGIAFSDLANISDLETRGIDFAVNYSTDMARWGFVPTSIAGDLSFAINATRLLNFTEDGFNRTGSNAGTGTSFPEWRGNLRTTYFKGPFTVQANLLFIDGVADGDPSDPDGFIPKQVYLDMSGAYDINENYQLQVGINNLTDNDPPLFSNNTQANTDPAQYDVIGRFFFVAARARF